MKAQLTKLLAQLHGGEWNERPLTDDDIWRVLTQPNAILITHEEDGRVVGFALLLVCETFSGRYSVMPEICVLDEFSGKNILLELMKKASHYAGAAECEALQVYVRASHKKALALFKAGGFVNGVWSIMTMKIKKGEP